MSYATQADLEARFGAAEVAQLASAGSVAQALADTAAEIDGHLAGRYTLPLDPVPAILTAYACDLARERLYKDAAPEIIVKRAEAARRFLRELAAGRISLGVQPPPEETSVVAHAAPARVFDALGLRGY